MRFPVRSFKFLLVLAAFSIVGLVSITGLIRPQLTSNSANQDARGGSPFAEALQQPIRMPLEDQQPQNPPIVSLNISKSESPTVIAASTEAAIVSNDNKTEAVALTEKSQVKTKIRFLNEQKI